MQSPRIAPFQVQTLKMPTHGHLGVLKKPVAQNLHEGERMAKNMEVEEEVEHESDAYEGDPQPFSAQHAPLECGIAQGFAAERGNEQQAIHSRQTLERASHAGEPPLTSSRCEERAEGRRQGKDFRYSQCEENNSSER